MRKVAFNKFGEKEFKNVGTFHLWAYSLVETEKGKVNFTVALVENEEGFIEEILPSQIKFIIT
jgi:hypothetical protein